MDRVFPKVVPGPQISVHRGIKGKISVAFGIFGGGEMQPADTTNCRVGWLHI